MKFARFREPNIRISIEASQTCVNRAGTKCTKRGYKEAKHTQAPADQTIVVKSKADAKNGDVKFIATLKATELTSQLGVALDLIKCKMFDQQTLFFDNDQGLWRNPEDTTDIIPVPVMAIPTSRCRLSQQILHRISVKI